MDSKNQEIYLKLYQVSNQRLIEETKEFYLANSVFLLLLSGIFGALGSEKIVINLQEYLLIGGLWITGIWFTSNIIQIMWKRWWHGKSSEIEKIILGLSENDKIKELEKKARETKPNALHLTAIFTFLPIIFTLAFSWSLNASPICFWGIITGEVVCLWLASYLFCPFNDNKKIQFGCVTSVRRIKNRGINPSMIRIYSSQVNSGQVEK